MKEYVFNVTDTTSKYVVVQGENESDARSVLENMLNNGEIDMEKNLSYSERNIKFVCRSTNVAKREADV